MRKRIPVFPELEKQMLMHGILKKDIADGLGITCAALSRKFVGQSAFTLNEACYITSLMPDIPFVILFDIDNSK